MRGLRRLRIGTQNALLILPLFLLLALASSLMSFRSNRAELRWGIDEEALSLAIAIAAFFDAQTVEALAAGDGDLRENLRSLRRWGQLRHLTLFDPTGEPRFELYDSRGAVVEPEPDLAATSPEPFLGEIHHLDGESFLTAYAPVEDELGRLVAWLRVETGVDDFFGAIEALRHRLAAQVLAALVFGLVLVIALTALVSPRIRQLADATDQVRKGLAPTHVPRGVLRELNDLTITFNTMTSVLGETVDRARRAVVDHEQLRSTEEIARTWARSSVPQNGLAVGGLEIVGHFGEEVPVGHFLHFARWSEGERAIPGVEQAAECDEPGGFVAVIGVLQGDQPLEQAARSAALGFFVEQHLDELDPLRLLARVRELFEARPLQLIFCFGLGKPIRWFGIAADGTLLDHGTARTPLLLGSASGRPRHVMTPRTEWIRERDTTQVAAALGKEYPELLDQAWVLVRALGW